MRSKTLSIALAGTLGFLYSLSLLDGTRSRLLISAAALFFTLSAWLLVGVAYSAPDRFARFVSQIPATPVPVGGWAALSLGIGWLFFWLPEARVTAWFGGLSGYVLRLQPLALTLLLTGLFVGVVTVLKDCRQKNERGEWRGAFWVFVFFLAAWAAIGLTGFGLGFDSTEWNAPGTPYLFIQVIALAGLSGLLAWLGRRSGWSIPSSDLFVFWGIWLVAAVIWIAQPQLNNYYAIEPHAPNFEFYPRSDAFNHDVMAENLLFGNGFAFNDIRVVRKPLYVLFLAGLHALTNSDYSLMANLQAGLLGLFPALLYLLVSRLHSRWAGLMAAGLVILREVNAFALTDVVNTVNVKMLMAELAAGVGVLLITFLAVGWLQDPNKRRYHPLWLGGAIGFFMLMRSQTGMLIPAIGVLMIGTLWGRWRQLAGVVALSALGVSLTLLPWVARNYRLAGAIMVEHSTAAEYVATRFTEEDLPPWNRAIETEGEQYARFVGEVRQAFIDHPLASVDAVGRNYVRNLLLSVFYLPMTFSLLPLETYVRGSIFWPSWAGDLPGSAILPLVLTLGLLSAGIFSAWRRWKWAGLAPLAVNLGFTLSLALGRVSGWRYSLPVDWTMLVYYVIGIVTICLWIARRPIPEIQLVTGEAAVWHWPHFGFAVGALLLAGLLLPGAEWASLRSAPHPQAVTEWLSAGNLPAAQRADLAEWAASGEFRVVRSHLLYPTYFNAGEMVVNQVGEFLPDQDRFAFVLAGEGIEPGVMVYQGERIAIEDGREALLIGCSVSDGYTLAGWVVIRTSAGDLLLQSDQPDFSCP